MKLEEFIGSAGFAAILTALVTLATCIITHFQGMRKLKIEKFQEIYDCLEKHSDKKEKIMARCETLIGQMEEKFPEEQTPPESLEESWRELYHDFHRLLGEYSNYLESLMSFYFFLYEDRPNIPAAAEQCWDILRLYASFTSVSFAGAEACRISYVQIVTLVQFLKRYTGLRGKRELYRYFKRNQVFQNGKTRLVKAFF